MYQACFHSFAKYLPSRVVPNHELTKFMDTSDEWIIQRTGIETRYWVEAPTTTSDLAFEAAQQSISLSKLNSIDAIVAATLSADYSFPGIGVQLQSKLKTPKIPAYDLRNQCAGFLYGAELAASLVKTGQYEQVLLVGAEVHSTGLDISTRGRDIAVLFGDGAGSCIVSRGKNPQAKYNFEFLGSELHSNGDFVKELWCEHPGSAHFPTRITMDLIEEAKCFPTMNGKAVFQHAVRDMTEVSLSLLSKLKLSPSDISLFLPHQANLRINSMVAQQLGLTEGQVFNTIQKYGNTTAATIPIGFTDAIEAGIMKPGMIILSAAFGSGFVWGASVWRVA